MEFEYKDIDAEGLSILDVISNADKFNRWTYNTISPYCKGICLEVGSGVGNISQFFVAEKKPISLSDIRLNYREILKKKFSLSDDRVINLDIALPDFSLKHKALLGKFDSVFCLNVVEHIKDDKLAISNMMELLKPGGKLTVLVPAYQALYNGFDVTLEHYRRYNKNSLGKLMAPFGKIERLFYFNSVGTLGWYVSGKLFKNKSIPEGEMKLFNSLVPLFKLVDKLTFQKIGLSVICILEKPQQANGA